MRLLWALAPIRIGSKKAGAISIELAELAATTRQPDSPRLKLVLSTT
jgi:hypothetical protein